jgi:hypothetical protein
MPGVTESTKDRQDADPNRGGGHFDARCCERVVLLRTGQARFQSNATVLRFLGVPAEYPLLGRVARAIHPISHGFHLVLRMGTLRVVPQAALHLRGGFALGVNFARGAKCPAFFS